MGNSLLGSRRSSSSSSSRSNTQRQTAVPSSSQSPSSTNKITKPGWNDSVVLKLITEKKLAPKESCTESDGTCECPICFLTYDGINIAKCCKQLICTSCYLLVKASPSSLPPCPFCSSNNFDVKCVNSSDINNPSGLSSPCSSLHSVSSDNISPPSTVKKSPAFIPLASIDDRKAIEREIKKSRSMTNRDTFEDRSHSRPALRNRHNSDGVINVSLARERLRNTEEGIYVGGQRISDRIDMRTIEDLMMDEAIRRSLAESESTSSAVETLPPAPTSSSSEAVQRNSVRHIDDIESVYIEMSEEEQLLLAISLSMKSDQEANKTNTDNENASAIIPDNADDINESDVVTSNKLLEATRNADDINESNVVTSNKLLEAIDNEVIHDSIDDSVNTNDSSNNENDNSSNDLLSKIDRILGNVTIADGNIESDNTGDNDNNSNNDINDIIINEILTSANDAGVDSSSTNNDVLL